MEGKVTLNFSGPAAAKRYIDRVRRLPFVTYATDYSRGGSRSAVMVCGQIGDPERELLLRLKKGAYK